MQGMKINPKEIFLGILAGGTGIGALWMWHALIPELLSGSGTYQSVAYAVFVLIASACFFVCAAFFIENFWLLYGITAVFGIAPIFLMDFRGSTIALVLIPVFFVLFAVYRMQNEAQYSCGFKPMKSMRAGLPYFFTAISCAGAIFYFGGLKQGEAVSSLLPRPVFNFTIRTLREPLQSIIGISSFDADDKVDDFLRSLLEAEFQKKGVKLSQVPKSEIDKLLAAQRAELSLRYGLRLNGKETIADVFYQTVIDRMEDFMGPYQLYIPYFSALAFFFAFKAFTFPLYIISVLITAGLIRLLIMSKILKNEIENITVERVTLA